VSPRAREDSVRPRFQSGASGRPLNFTVRRFPKRMRYVLLSVLILAFSSPATADEHQWFAINDIDAACEPLDGPVAASPPIPGLKTPEQVLALKKKEWPDATLVTLLDFAARLHVPQTSIPVDLRLVTKSNALVVWSKARNARLLLLRDDACWRIDSDAHQ
jgi:hypothetical protein